MKYILNYITQINCIYTTVELFNNLGKFSLLNLTLTKRERDVIIIDFDETHCSDRFVCQIVLVKRYDALLKRL